MSFEIKDGALIRYTGTDKCVTIPEEVTRIERNAFRDRQDVTDVILHTGVKSIGYAALPWCKGRLRLHIPSLTWWCGAGLGGFNYYQLYCNGEKITHLTIPEGVTHIADNAFVYCISLKQVTIPMGVTCIGEGAFIGCVNLQSVDIAPSVSTIRSYAFSGCEKLTSVTLREGVTTIDDCAFAHCRCLTDLHLPASVRQIGKTLFRNSSQLTLHLADLAWWCEKRAGLSDMPYTLCLHDTPLTDITLPDGITVVGMFAFEGCDSLTSVVVPPSVTCIEHRAFARCANLKSITLPASVQRIQPEAFLECTSLERITFLGEKISLLLNEDGNLTFPAGVQVCVRSLSMLHNLSTAARRENEDPLFTICLTDDQGEILTMRVNNSGTAGIYAEYLNALYTLRYPYGTDDETIAAVRRYVTGAAYQRIVLRLLEEKNHDMLYYLLSLRTPSLDLLDTIVETVTAQGDAEETARIMQYQNMHYTAEERQKHADRELRALFTHDPNSVTELKKLWSVRANGAIYSYKGDDPHAVVPAMIGKIRITAIESIGKRGKEVVTSVEIPEGVKELCEGAFKGCEKLSSVTLPAGLTAIGASAFSGCRQLTSIVLPDGVTSIEAHTFAFCASLQDITVPPSVASIGQLAFWGCPRIALHLSDIDAWCRRGLTVEIDHTVYLNGEELKVLTIPADMTSIGTRLFSACHSLTDVTIPASVTSIGRGAFLGCPNLTIHAPRGSCAEAHAKGCDIPFIAI